MAFPVEPSWKLNITTEDIVYPFDDGTKTIYRKETIAFCSAEDIVTPVTTILEICTDRKGDITERIVRPDEFSVEQFDEIKAWSDVDYRAQQRAYVHGERRVVVSIYEMEKSIKLATWDTYSWEEVEEYRTVENAKRILDEMKLTESQRRRFMLSIAGMSAHKIAKREGVNQKSVWECLNEVETKRKKFFLKNAENTPSKGPKNDEG